MKKAIVLFLLLTACSSTKATIDPNREKPVIVVNGQMSGEYSCEEYTVKWDSKKPSILDRILDTALFSRFFK